MKKISKKLLSVLLIIAMIVPTGSLMVNTSAADVLIPDDAVEFNGHYYKAYEEKKSWNDAKKACEDMGGHLVTITSKEENEFVFGLIDGFDETVFLIGFDDYKTEGIWEWVTGELVDYTNWGEMQPDNCEELGGQDFAYICSKEDAPSQCESGQWDDYAGKTPYNFICEWEPNIYNMGEETYSFKNFGDSDSECGHCFGMAVTSSGYYLDLLAPTDVSASSSREIYSLSDNATVREPICYYHTFQGSVRNNAFVAGGNGIETDWNEITNYVSNHAHDNKGDLVLGFGIKNQGGHAVNFLRYEVVNGQERIYVYDNNCSHKEAYFYKDNDNKVHHQAQNCQANCGMITGIVDDHMALVSVSKFISNTKTVTNYQNIAIYGNASIQVENSTRYLMYGDIGQGEHYVYEINEDVTTVKITPLADNASFTYLGQEYTFDEINDNTYAELTLSVNDETIPEFEIFNTPADEPAEPDVPDIPENTEKNCSCNCHSNAFMQFLHKIVSFLRKLFGMTQYQYCDCGKAHW